MNFDEGTVFRGPVAVRACSIGRAKNGTDYLNLSLSDGTSEIQAKKWQHSGDVPELNSIIDIVANYSTYQGQPQLTIIKWTIAEPGSYKLDQFLPSYPGDRMQLWQTLIEEAAHIEDEKLREFVLSFFTAYEKDMYNAPAAISHHHAYLGGWMQHTLEVLHYALVIALQARYQVNFDLLRAGAILHDIGKIRSYKYSGAVIEMSEMGKHLEHIVIGILTVYDRAKQLVLDPIIVRDLLHIIASHHGVLQFGSPIEPILKEAVIINRADGLSATLDSVDSLLTAATERGKGWTDRSPVGKFPLKVRS